jgi:hypothetical protein
MDPSRVKDDDLDVCFPFGDAGAVRNWTPGDQYALAWEDHTQYDLHPAHPWLVQFGNLSCTDIGFHLYNGAAHPARGPLS